jgi:hypothetical protein
MQRLAGAAALALGLPWLAAAAEPRMDASLVVGATHFDEFDRTTVDLAASFSYRLSGWLAAEAQLGFSPSDLGEPPFSTSRFEGFLGARGSIPLGPLRGFAAFRPGFVRLAEAEEPFPCIAIYPPPLACSLQAGRTLLGLQLGAGLELPIGARALARVEFGSLLLRYPGPALTRDGAVTDDSFWRHNGRASLALGLRF